VLAFLKGIAGLVTGVFSGLWHDVVSLVTTVYNDIVGSIGDVIRYADGIYDDLVTLSRNVADFVDREYDAFVAWVRNEFNDIVKSLEHDISDVENYAEDVYHWALTQLDTIAKYAYGIIDNVTKWVISDIWDPLYNNISGALSWIGNEGAYLYDLVSHPDKLVDFIISYIWSAWLSLFRQYAPQLISYVLSNWQATIPDIASVLEDIISSLF